jgi:hypothetical protein
MSSVRTTEAKDCEKTNRGNDQKTVDYAATLQLLIVELHRQYHHHETNCHPHALFDHVIELVAVLLFSHNS